MPTLGEKYIPPIKLHLGSSLAEKLEELELSPQDFAKQIGVEDNIVVDIVEEKGAITPSLADAFEQALKIPAAFWLRKQKRYREFVEKQESSRAIEYIPKTIGHPGISLAGKLEEMDVSPKDFAKEIGADESVIMDIVTEKDEGRISTELAEAFHKALGIPAHYWIRRQELYDELVLNNETEEARLQRRIKQTITEKHPGDILAEEIDKLKIPPVEFAKQTGMDIEIIMGLIMEESTMSRNLAEELEKHLNISARSWLNMQQGYDKAYEEAVAKLELVKA